ncbi:MAG: AMP-binding protein [Mariniblastus sp.]
MNEPSIDHNVASLLAGIAARTPDKIAFASGGSDGSETISFGKLWHDANATVGGLTNLGLKKGDRVIVMIPMSVDLYVCLLAIIQMGAIAVFVDPWVGAKQIAFFSAFAEPSAFIGINKSHLLRWSNRRLRKIKISVTNESRIGVFPARYSLPQIKKTEPITKVAAVRPDDTALITFTSGSSAHPKGANRTHRFLLSQHLALKKEFPYQPDDIDMPMFPVFALNNLVTGITSVIPNVDPTKKTKNDGRDLLDQMNFWKVTTCTASPSVLKSLRFAIESTSRNNGDKKVHLRRILTGGAPISSQQLQRWTSTFASGGRPTQIIVAYGSTEAEPVCHIEASERIELEDQRRGSKSLGFCTGKPSDLVRTKIVPITSEAFDLSKTPLSELELPHGEIGELVVAGGHVCRDYFKNPSATKAHKLVDINGTVWHRMGDTGYFDDENRFWLVGRIHSTIQSSGKFVHPQIVERIAMEASSEIKQVAAIGVKDPVLVEAIVLVVVTDSKAQPAIETLIRDALKKHQQTCDRVLFTQKSLPVDPRHHSKIDYEKVRKIFEN